MQFTSESYVVLWSPHQNSFYIETVSEMIGNNRGNFFAKRDGGDFIVLGVTNSREDADSMLRPFRDFRDNSAT